MEQWSLKSLIMQINSSVRYRNSKCTLNCWDSFTLLLSLSLLKTQSFGSIHWNRFTCGCIHSFFSGLCGGKENLHIIILRTVSNYFQKKKKKRFRGFSSVGSDLKTKRIALFPGDEWGEISELLRPFLVLFRDFTVKRFALWQSSLHLVSCFPGKAKPLKFSSIEQWPLQSKSVELFLNAFYLLSQFLRYTGKRGGK